MKKKLLSVFLFFILFFSKELYAFQENSCGNLVWIPSLTYCGGNGRSYHHGYTSVSTFFAPYYYPKNHYFFLDGEAHRVDGGHLATNLGVGMRWFAPEYNMLVGINSFYDFRHTHRGNFNQIGLGCELLGPLWDLRANGYIPVGGHSIVLQSSPYTSLDDLIVTQKKLQVAIWGGDLEVGSCFSFRCLQFYSAIGPYFYHSKCCQNILGGMGRVALKCFPYVTGQIIVTYDPLYQTKVQLELTFSLFAPSVLKDVRSAFRPIWRNRIILIEKLSTWETNF